MRQRELIEGEQEIGLPLLGYTVVTSLKGIEVNRPSLLAAVDALDFKTRLGTQLSTDYIPGLPEANTALKRAVKRWMHDQCSTEAGKAALGLEEDDKTMWRDITRGSKSDIIAIALVTESSDLQAWGLSYLTNLRVFYTKSTDTLLLTTERTAFDLQSLQRSAADRALLAGLEPHWQYYREVYVSTDLSRMVQRILDAMHPADLRKDGRVYFVPSLYRDALQKLKDLIEVLLPAAPGQENTSSLNAIPVIDRPSTRKQLGTIAYKSTLAELKTLQADLERFVLQAQTPKKEKDNETVKTDAEGEIVYKKVKPSTIVERVEMYKNMRNKITLYTEKLGMQQEELVAELDRLQATARSLVDVETDDEDEENQDAEVASEVIV